jgi:dTMP kinase
MSGRGRFIVFEGGDGCGKSTQAARLAAALGAVLTRQPGGTPIGAKLRQILLDRAHDALDDRAEALLYAADKAQHVREVIEPALAAGRDVVCDRYVASSVVYQGSGRGLDVEHLTGLLQWATHGLEPDLVLLLEVPVDVMHQRLGAVRDRLESLPASFHERVRDGFRTLAAGDPDRWVTVDATGEVDDVAALVAAAVARRWPG